MSRLEKSLPIGSIGGLFCERFQTHGTRVILWIQGAVFQVHPIDPKLF